MRINMIVAAFGNEVIKLVHTKLPYISLIAILFLCMSTLVLTGKSAGQEGFTGWGFVSLSFQVIFADFGLLFVVLFAAMLMADETGTGVIRFFLPSPMSRGEFFIAKVLTGFLYFLILSLSTLLCSFILGLFRYQFGGISDDIGLIYSRTQVVGHFLIALLMSWIPLTSAVAYGILMSVSITNPAKAVAASLGVMYTLNMTKHILGFENICFLRYVGLPWALFHQVAQGVDCQWYPAIVPLIVVCVLTSVLCLTVAALVFNRQDMN